MKRITAIIAVTMVAASASAPAADAHCTRSQTYGKGSPRSASHVEHLFRVAGR